jgi:hypothetical protein
MVVEQTSHAVGTLKYDEALVCWDTTLEIKNAQNSNCVNRFWQPTMRPDISGW